MVNHGGCLRSVLAAAMLLAGGATARELAEYRAGDLLEADLTTPVALKVVDLDATRELKEKEAMRVLVILRFDSSVAAQVEAGLHGAFSSTRSNFLRAIERRFQRRQLSLYVVAGPEFDQLCTTFQRTNRAYPMSKDLAITWAIGDVGHVDAVALDQLRNTMRQPIRDPNAPATIRVTSRARLITVATADEELTPENLGNRGRTIMRADAISLDRARRDLISNSPPERQAMGRFLASLLQVNCRMEEELTEKIRARNTEALWVLAEYQPGDLVARAGQRVDAKVLAAIQGILEHRAQQALKESLAQTAARAREVERQLLWLTFGGAGLVVVLGVIAWQWSRRRRAQSWQLATLAGNGVSAGSVEAQAWQQRALEAERQVERAHEALRAGVMEQVSHVLQDRLVSELATHRRELIEAQQAAAAEMEALDRRLNEMHAPLQERLQAYEARVAELERALASKDDQNRELLKAKIELLRKQLAAQRTETDTVLN